MASALFVPDIRDLVCDLLSPTSAANLAQTSWYFFRSSVRHLWGQNVVPLERLLVLLPGVALDEWFGLKVYPSAPLSSTYFNRFNLYAPHVKQLLSDFTWDPSSVPLHSLAGWPHIQTLAKLPRLVSLTISQTGGSGTGLSELFQLLISSSLLIVKMSSASWDQGSVRRFVGLVRACPELKSLSVVGSGKHIQEEQDEALESSFELVVPRNLETLELSASDLHPQFLTWIGRMPNLRELRLTDSFEPDLEAFEDDSFVALCELNVEPSTIESAIRVWEIPMVQALTSATIALRVGRDEFWAARMSEFLDLVRTRSPRLKKLSLVVLEAGNATFPVEWLSSINQLALDSLSIQGVPISGVHIFSQVARLWPGLISLNVCDTIATIDHLVQVASGLPRLAELSLKIAPDAVASLPVTRLPTKRTTNQRLTLRSTFGCVVGQPEVKWDLFARFLAGHWPNIKCVHACKIKERSGTLGRLNAQVAKYSQA
ncbi:hypothetical protein RhiLY_09808 [Ceratobasidium sp. AG-Ba]|nr:hypothetical protein RhiLY_09808 [Ceratobasidium sp. AG-Ba]